MPSSLVGEIETIPQTPEQFALSLAEQQSQLANIEAESEKRAEALREIDWKVRDLISSCEEHIASARKLVQRAVPDWEQAERLADLIEPLEQRVKEIRKGL